MHRPLAISAFVLASTLLSGCAPDAWKPDRAFDARLAELGEACEGKTIGYERVENLARGRTKAAIFFVDQTSRLYEGRITPDGWTTGVTAFMNGWRDDPGVRCVLDQYARDRLSAPPSSSPPTR